MEFNKINDKISVFGQITREDIAQVKLQGFKAIINNRPDAEVTPDIDSAAMEEAARAHGLDYIYLPVTPGAFTPELVKSFKEMLDKTDGPVFAYCRSGMRSCTAWGLSQAGTLPADMVLEQGAGAGYDLGHIADYLKG